MRVDGNGFKVDRKYDLPVRAGVAAGDALAQTRVLDALAPVDAGRGLRRWPDARFGAARA